jgi:sugar-specific transcriptional regulator TrmB
MSGPTVKSTLMEIGLSDRESDLYVYLAKTGHQTAARIAKGLRMHKAQVYYILRSLERKGIVESTFSTPAQFNVLPLEQLLNRHIQTKEEELNQFKQHQKPHVLSQWESMTPSPLPSSLETFMVIEGHDHTYEKVRQMLLDARREVLFIGNAFGITRAQQYNVIETANTEAQRRNLTYRLIVEVTPKHDDEQESLLNALGPRFHTRHRDLSAQFVPQFIVKDDDEVLLFLWPSDEERQESTGLWSNNPAIVNTLKVLYEGLWNDAVDLDEQKRIAVIDAEFQTLLAQSAQQGRKRYIVFLESNPMDGGKLLERQREYSERRRREYQERTGEVPSERLIRTGLRPGWESIFHAHSMSLREGFLVCEADDEGIRNYRQDVSPYLKARFVPIVPWTQLKDLIARYKAFSDLLYT